MQLFFSYLHTQFRAKSTSKFPFQKYALAKATHFLCALHDRPVPLGSSDFKISERDHTVYKQLQLRVQTLASIVKGLNKRTKSTVEDAGDEED